MFTLFKSNPIQAAADLAYSRVVEQARQPAFFANLGIPDTLDGRFELICLHAFLYLHRLKQEAEGGALGQRFFDTMFADFDRSLREMGTGDLSVGRQIGRMVEAFYGRINAYEQGLAADDDTLKPALERNLFGTTTPNAAQLAAMAAYLRREMAQLGRQRTTDLLAGAVAFGPPPQLHAPAP